MVDVEKLRAREFRKKNNARFGGLRVTVLERDNYQCVECGMTQAKHLALWNKSLTIDHINNLGRTTKKPDNRLDNLQTLCLRCHGKKDGPKWMTVEVQ